MNLEINGYSVKSTGYQYPSFLKIIEYLLKTYGYFTWIFPLSLALSVCHLLHLPIAQKMITNFNGTDLEKRTVFFVVVFFKIIIYNC